MGRFGDIASGEFMRLIAVFILLFAWDWQFMHKGRLRDLLKDLVKEGSSK